VSDFPDPVLNFSPKRFETFWDGARVSRPRSLSGHLFLFLNCRRDRVKVLFRERDGLVIWYQRLGADTFQQLDPTARSDHASGTAGLELTVIDLALLLNGIDLATARLRKRLPLRHLRLGKVRHAERGDSSAFTGARPV